MNGSSGTVGLEAAALRAIDMGSFKNPKFSTERLPTLAEALAICKGRCPVIVELKSYGHNQQLEERVAAIVEETGMQDDCEYMSLNRTMVKRMKALRPSWRVGLLVAKAMGDLTELKADFLAVEARMATRRFVDVRRTESGRRWTDYGQAGNRAQCDRAACTDE